MPEEPLSMMSQENYVNINDLHAQGWTINEIAAATGWHRTTVSNYLKNGPPPATWSTEATVMTEHWQQRSWLLAHVNQ
jgi:IS30 family transposase